MPSQIMIPDNVSERYAGKPMPRGIRNNNPGNVRLGDNWQGLCDVQLDPAFCQFKEITFGLRCLAFLLRVSYYQRKGLRTVRDIISKWAPSAENDTERYVAAVALAMQALPNEPVDWNDDNRLGTLMAAIIKHENGAQPYSGMQLVAGIRMLGR